MMFALPLMALTVLNACIVKIIFKARIFSHIRRRRRQQQQQQQQIARQESEPISIVPSSRKAHVTKLLAAITTAYLFSYVPFGILALLDLIYGQEFIENVHRPFAQILDTQNILIVYIDFICLIAISEPYQTMFKMLFIK